MQIRYAKTELQMWDHSGLNKLAYKDGIFLHNRMSS